MHILNQRTHIIVVQSSFEGRHDAATVQDYVPQLTVRCRRAAGEGLFSKQPVQPRRIFNQVEVRRVMASCTNGLVNLTASKDCLVSLHALARTARGTTDEAANRN